MNHFEYLLQLDAVDICLEANPQVTTNEDNLTNNSDQTGLFSRFFCIFIQI